jgi:hypothetical protein
MILFTCAASAQRRAPFVSRMAGANRPTALRLPGARCAVPRLDSSGVWTAPSLSRVIMPLRQSLGDLSLCLLPTTIPKLTLGAVLIEKLESSRLAQLKFGRVIEGRSPRLLLSPHKP